jgi:hypothetical protein
MGSKASGQPGTSAMVGAARLETRRETHDDLGRLVALAALGQPAQRAVELELV